MIENHVPQLETCRRLKELGWEKKTLFTHWNNTIIFNGCFDLDADIAPAPILSEILEELPNKTEWGYIIIGKTYDNFVMGYDAIKGIAHKNPAEAAAQLWEALKAEGIQ